MTFNVKTIARSLMCVVLALGSTMTASWADDSQSGRKKVVDNAKWKEDCGACHLAFPPRMLPAESWRAVMAGLDDHFGSDASLDAAEVSEITEFLEKHARKKGRVTSGKPLLRITETRWFLSEHDEVSASVWKDPKVKSPANCGACHTKAESGDYSERNIKIPK